MARYSYAAMDMLGDELLGGIGDEDLRALSEDQPIVEPEVVEGTDDLDDLDD